MPHDIISRDSLSTYDSSVAFVKEEKNECMCCTAYAIVIRMGIDSRILSRGHELINHHVYTLLIFRISSNLQWKYLNYVIKYT